MIYSVCTSVKELVPFVKSIWSYSDVPKHRFEVLLPRINGQLLVNLQGIELSQMDLSGAVSSSAGPVALHGIMTKRCVINTEQKRNICGVEFEPGGLCAFAEEKATYFRDNIVDARETWGDRSMTLRTSLMAARNAHKQCEILESFLAERLIRRPAEDVLLDQSLAGLRQGKRIQDIKNELGLSQRKLHALFDRRVGVRPKLFTRIARLSLSLSKFKDKPSLVDLAYEHGYSDQSHYTREFGQFTGTNPSDHQPIEGEFRHIEFEADKMFKTQSRKSIKSGW